MSVTRVAPAVVSAAAIGFVPFHGVLWVVLSVAGFVAMAFTVRSVRLHASSSRGRHAA
ncbi:hypothetical protein G3I59_40580 [Amycolatopsis rubida]|uniref:Uncharacterized protein n=1 Tax=Amycolatopsis rubida TaxID=112413 RepID=A0A1I5I883_9PSEU|nr:MULTISPECIES: hypothetical protein [Amycolatopsis]MYW96743.1 hypothetical protein [Amycolatopsis rubida]NEC61728.1 hypothetical protein [Amycolatopsis rubida]OAP25785.1 hypothetical protein A4R44_03161 [Amycolatopsis sp. M39]SFO56782.1 hypothetical protein SAMN05421854_102328 [Amycolatopsis rubida]